MWNYLFMLVAAGAATFLFYDDKKELKRNAIVAGVALVVSYLLFVWLAQWSSILFCIILMAAAGFGVSVMYENFSISTHWKQLAVALVAVVVVVNLCGGNTESSHQAHQATTVEHTNHAEDTRQKCSFCKGSGVCSTCNGRGFTYPSPYTDKVKNICYSCNQSGRCPVCNGKGY